MAEYGRGDAQAGHHALSDCAAANTALGVLAHTFVLTPYHAWRITHALHHVRALSLSLSSIRGAALMLILLQY